MMWEEEYEKAKQHRRGTRAFKCPMTTDVLTDQKEYQSMVGNLMYAMLATRPDLAQCIQQI
jgi:hypothetical protein